MHRNQRFWCIKMHRQSFSKHCSPLNWNRIKSRRTDIPTSTMYVWIWKWQKGKKKPTLISIKSLLSFNSGLSYYHITSDTHCVVWSTRLQYLLHKTAELGIQTARCMITCHLALELRQVLIFTLWAIPVTSFHSTGCVCLSAHTERRRVKNPLGTRGWIVMFLSRYGQADKWANLPNTRCGVLL